MIYENVLRLCRERGIAVARLEKETGLGNATVRGWATSSPQVDKLKSVADFFGVTVDSLIRDEKSPAGPEGGS